MSKEVSQTNGMHFSAFFCFVFLRNWLIAPFLRQPEHSFLYMKDDQLTVVYQEQV